MIVSIKKAETYMYVSAFFICLNLQCFDKDEQWVELCCYSNVFVKLSLSIS